VGRRVGGFFGDLLYLVGFQTAKGRGDVEAFGRGFY